MAQAACQQARRGLYDVLIVDTAGRLHVDTEMMAEIRAIEQAISATERLFVVDAMAGQDAVNAARAFNEALALTGIVLTKADGDSRGGAGLSVRHVTADRFYSLGSARRRKRSSSFTPTASLHASSGWGRARPGGGGRAEDRSGQGREARPEDREGPQL